MAEQGSLILAALGGAVTFGGEAALRMVQLYPEFRPEVVFYPTAEEAFGAVLAGKADATCAPEQMSATGFHHGSQSRLARPDSPAFVAAEVTHGYHCALLVKPGAPTEGIREVQGHTGSITQSRQWLEKHLPQAKITIVDTSSFGAAQAVVDSDGSIASVGTPAAARQFGLEMRHTEIDGGSVASYWGFSARPIFVDTPNRVILAGRMEGDGSLTDVVQAMASAGYKLSTCFPEATGRKLFEYDYALRFVGSGRLASVQEAVRAFPTVRVAGAYQGKE